MRYVYLHGFASSPQSRKARSFMRTLEHRQISLEIPDLAEGDFEHITISSQLSVVERSLQGEPARLIGSSMGGYLASLYAAAHPKVERLVLLAPAFGFAARWQELMGPEKLRVWKESDITEVFHYGQNAAHPLRYALYADALQYSPYPDFSQPAQIYHGRHDEVVPVEYSRTFASSHPSVQLHELDSDHELLTVLEHIVGTAMPFLTE